MTRAGERNDAFYRGAYGSKRDPSWSRELNQHTCCGSKHPKYHKSSCPSRQGAEDLPDPKPRESRFTTGDPVKDRAARLKAEGHTSGDIARITGMPLKQVNEIWHEI